ncbi:hypothetical protein RJ035_006980, partial [Blastomyces gilchristii]
MSSRPVAKALRGPVARSLSTASSIPRRSFVSAAVSASARPAATSALRAPFVAAPSAQQTRGVKTIDFAGTKETVY